MHHMSSSSSHNQVGPPCEAAAMPTIATKGAQTQEGAMTVRGIADAHRVKK